MISTGAFQTEMNASNKQETLAEKFAAVWEKKNIKAARAGGLSLMALSLAACGSSDDAAVVETPAVETPATETPTTETPVVETPTTPVATALVAGTDQAGTAGADSFSGTVATLTSNTTLVGTDDIAGGEGADTIALALGANFGGFTTTGTDTGSMTGIETVELSATGSIARTFDATGVSGVETYKVDGTNAVVSITGSADLAAIELSSMASGAFSITYAAPTGGTSPVAGTADTLNLTVQGMGSATADVSVTAAGVEALSITSNAAATAAGATNYLNVSGVSGATSTTIAGAADTDIAAVSTATTSFDASGVTGAVTAALGNAATGALTSVKTGAGADKVTGVAGDFAANATIALGEGADTLVLSGVMATTQFVMSGVETLDFTDVTGATTMSMAKSDGTAATVVLGEAGAATPNPLNTTSLTFIGDSGAKNFDLVGDSAGAISTDTTGAIDIDVTADAKATKANGGDTAAATVTAANASSVDVSVTGFVNQTGAITAAKATSATLTLGSDQAQTATKLAVAKAETLTITAANTGTTVINAGSDFTAAKVVTLDASGTLNINEALPAATSVTVSGAGAKAKLDADQLIGATTLTNDLTVTASGLTGGFDTSAAGIDSGLGNLTLNLNGIASGAITTGAINSDATLTLNADTLGAVTTGATAGKAVVIDTADVLGATTFGTITSDSLTMTGSNMVANTVTVGGSTSTTAATAMTVDYTGGILVDTVNVNGTTSTNSITVKGDAGLGTDVYTITLANYGTLGTAATVAVDLSGIVADTTSQSTVVVDIKNEADNAMTLTGSKGSNDTIDVTVGTNATYSADLTISGFEKLDLDGDIGFTAASLSGVTITVDADAARVVTLTGTANGDTVTYANVTAGTSTPTLTINAGNGDDSVTGSAGVDTIDGQANDDTITGGEGADVITGGTGNDTIILTETAAAADVVVIGATHLTNANHDTVKAFAVGSDQVRIDATFTSGNITDGAVTAEYQTDAAAGAVLVAAGEVIVELSWEFDADVDLDTATKTDFLSALGAADDATNSSKTAQTFTVDADQDAVMAIAYQDSNAYFFKITDGANSGADAAETILASESTDLFELVGVFEDIAVGGFTFGDFVA